jgi:hypothetical protein
VRAGGGVGMSHLVPRGGPSLWRSHALCRCTPTGQTLLSARAASRCPFGDASHAGMWSYATGGYDSTVPAPARKTRAEIRTHTHLVGPVMSTVRPTIELTPTFSSVGNARHTHSFCALGESRRASQRGLGKLGGWAVWSEQVRECTRGLLPAARRAARSATPSGTAFLTHGSVVTRRRRPSETVAPGRRHSAGVAHMDTRSCHPTQPGVGTGQLGHVSQSGGCRDRCDGVCAAMPAGAM